MASSAKKRSKGSKATNAKRKRRHSGSEEEEPAFLLSKYAEPPTSKIYNSRFSHKDPAELFRKDLISAMKLADNEPLAATDYWLIEDSWKPEWERGVQVPVYPDSLPEPNVRSLRKKRKDSHFKLPKKLIRFTRDNFFNPEVHIMSYTNTLAERTCRYDMDDVDLRWLTLVNEEREDFGLQPLEEAAVEQMIDEFEVQSYVNFQESIKSEEGLGNQYDEDAICDVCRSPDYQEGNEMVFCDSCNICVHQICYGITKIPEGSWICRTCALGIRPACVLCPNRGGAMKTTRCGQKWAHVGCAVWIPEVSFFNFVKMEPITKISLVPLSRWSLICSICKEKAGACIQCSEKNCKTAFHVTCAFQEGLQMRASVKSSDSDDDKLQAFCKKHSRRKRSNESAGRLVSDEDGLDVVGDSSNKRSSLSSEERANVRQQKIQAKEAEFYNYVNLDDVADMFNYDRIDIEIVYNYWKLKRKANLNRALLPPKFDSDNNDSEDDSPFVFLKKMVHHRQDLERARNLCYMVIKRERLYRRWIHQKELIFMKQIQVLAKLGAQLSDKELEAVRKASFGDLVYDKKYTGANCPSPNTISVLTTLIGEGAVKTQLNGILKNSRKSDRVPKSGRTPNPYAKHYLNGLLKRSQRWFASVDKHRKVPSFLDAGDCQNLSFQSSSDHVVSDDGFESSKDIHDLQLADKSSFNCESDSKFVSFSASDDAFNGETYHNESVLKDSDQAEVYNKKEEIRLSEILFRSIFSQSSNDSNFMSPSKSVSAVDEFVSDEELKVTLKSDDEVICNESRPSGLENNQQDSVLCSESVEAINKPSESNEQNFDTEINKVCDNNEDLTDILDCSFIENLHPVHDPSENIKFNLDIPIENCVEVESEENTAIDDNVNKESEIEFSDLKVRLENCIDISKDKKLNSPVHCVIVKTDIPLMSTNGETLTIKVNIAEGCDKIDKGKANKLNSLEANPKISTIKTSVTDTSTKEVKIRPASSKNASPQNQSSAAQKVTENGLIKSSKLSPKQGQEKNIKQSPAKCKNVSNSHTASSPVHKHCPSSPSNKCQEKNASRNDDTESAETTAKVRDFLKESSAPAPVLRKDMLRGYKIPKKPRTEKPDESNSLDLKRGSTPLSPLPDITSSCLSNSYQINKPHQQPQSCWRKMEPRTNTNSKPQINLNGNIPQQSSSERLVLKLKKDMTDPGVQKWKSDPINFNHNHHHHNNTSTNTNNLCSRWVVGDFSPMHPPLLPPPPPPPFLTHSVSRPWPPRMRGRGGFGQIHMGYGNGPYT